MIPEIQIYPWPMGALGLPYDCHVASAIRHEATCTTPQNCDCKLEVRIRTRGRTVATILNGMPVSPKCEPIIEAEIVES